MSHAFIKVNSTYTVFLDKPITVDSSHRFYEKIADILDNEKDESIEQYLHQEQKFAESLGETEFEIIDGSLCHYGKALTGYLANRIVELFHEGKPYGRIVKFLKNLLENPSNRVYEHLYQFLELGKNPITEDGCFLAYKLVRDDYTDCYSGTISNRVGSVISMPRQAVDDNPNNTCSHGLHICSYEYLKHFTGKRLMVTKQNPRDVVSIPEDYNHTKMRVCCYEIIQEIPLDSTDWTDRYPDENLDKEPKDLKWSIELERTDEDAVVYYHCFAVSADDAEEKALEAYPHHSVVSVCEEFE